MFDSSRGSHHLRVMRDEGGQGWQPPAASGSLVPAGDVVKWFNTEVCKTSIHRFESGRRLHHSGHETGPNGPVSSLSSGPSGYQLASTVLRARRWHDGRGVPLVRPGTWEFQGGRSPAHPGPQAHVG